MSRGGARPGAGRKRREDRTTITISVSRRTKEQAAELRKAGYSTSEACEYYIGALYADVFPPFDYSE